MASDDTPEPFADDPTTQESQRTAERSGPVPINERNTGTYSGSPEFVAGARRATRPASRPASRRRCPPCASS
jgi:hypothetical protein